MLGNNLYRIENCIDLSNDDIKSLSLFYRPLIGSHAFALYMNLAYTNMFVGYHELNEICVLLNVSIDKLERMFSILNKYRLVRTLKKEEEERYIFVVEKPLSTSSFIKNTIYVRCFILKCGGEVYQDILSNLKESAGSHKGFKDVSDKMDPDVLDSWNEENESYVKKRNDTNTYSIDCFFDINEFLKDISDNLFPKKYRTFDNLKLIGEMADLYNISMEKMRTYIPKVIRSASDSFDSKLLKNLCMSSISDYRTVNEDSYNVPCVLYWMNLQDGKEVTEYERKIIFNLSNSYNLAPSVINALIQHHLKKYDNRIIEKILYSEASDLHRNNCDTPEKALERLEYKTNNRTSKDIHVDYSKGENDEIDMSNLEKFLNERQQ